MTQGNEVSRQNGARERLATSRIRNLPAQGSARGRRPHLSHDTNPAVGWDGENGDNICMSIQYLT